MTTSTRIIYADTPRELLPICKTVGYIRADVWRRYGGLKTGGKSLNDIRNEISRLALYSNVSIDGTIRNESTKDIVNDVFLYRAAAQQKVRKSIHARSNDDKEERKRLYNAPRVNGLKITSYIDRCASTSNSDIPRSTTSS